MFGLMPDLIYQRKPRAQWSFHDNKMTGINATRGYLDDGIILPYDLSDEQRDLILWAYEWAYTKGEQHGREQLQNELRQLIRAERS